MGMKLDKQELDRIRGAMNAADRSIQPFRNQRRDALREYVGSQYGDRGTTCRTPINLMHFATEVFTTSLAAGTPQALITTTNRNASSNVHDHEIALNTLATRIKLGEVVNEATFDAIYALGIVRTGRTRDETYGMSGFSKSKGRPYARIVSFDDFIFDTQATSWRDVAFLGNRYRIPLEEAKKNKGFNAAARAALVKTTKTQRQATGEERASDLSRPEQYDVDEIVDYVELVDVYLCRERRVLTLNMEGEITLLRDVEYTGPDGGPYDILFFDRPAEQLIPVAKAWQWIDLHWLVNDLWRKAAEDAINSKTVSYSMPGASKDGVAIQNARNGDHLTLTNPQGLGTFNIPGADQATLLMAQQAQMQFNKLFGNPEVLAGVGAQSDTYGQDQLVMGAANRMVGGMEGRVVAFAQSILEKLLFYILTDHEKNLRLEKPIPMTDLSVSFDYTGDRAKGDIFDFNVIVEPYSLQRMTPAMRLRFMTEAWNTIIMPGYQAFQAEGAAVSIQKYLDRWSRLANIQSDLSGVVTYSSVPPQGMDEERSRAPAMTVRKTVREGRRAPGAGSDEAIAAALTNGLSSGGRGAARQTG